MLRGDNAIYEIDIGSGAKSHIEFPLAEMVCDNGIFSGRVNMGI